MNAELKGIYEAEIERYDRILIAAEAWSKGYKKDRKTFKKAIKIEARLRREVRAVFREMASKVADYIDWSQYTQQQAQVTASAEPLNAAIDVKVIVKDTFYNELDALFFSVTFETISTAIGIGAEAGENLYKIPLGIRSSDAAIQELTTDRLAWLIGKRVDKSGNVVDNPKAEYRISNKTREDISSNIKTGIALGEDRATMTRRLDKIVSNPGRAEQIAQTETINAYGQGILEFGRESGATGKEWEDVNATDVCAQNAAEGIIPLEANFMSGDSSPAAHTGCRCNLRIVYENEFPANA